MDVITTNRIESSIFSKYGANNGNSKAKTDVIATSKTNNSKSDTLEISDEAKKKNLFGIEKKQEFSTNQSQKVSDSDQQKINDLKKIDAQVKAHERAHIAAGGNLVKGGANFTYEVGPDGKKYATSGEVSIDMSYDESKPRETISKMQKVRSAALAPADPSSTDQQVASEASRIESQAQVQLRKIKMEETNSEESKEIEEAPQN